MKILVMSNLYRPLLRGGAEKIVERLVGMFRKQGHSVMVATTRPFWNFRKLDDTEDVLRMRNFNLYFTLDDGRFPWPMRLLWHVIDMFQPLTFLWLMRVFFKKKPDIIFSHNIKGMGMSAFLAIRLYRILKKKTLWIHTPHDIQLAYPSGVLIRGEESRYINRSRLRQWYQAYCRVMIDSPDVVLSPSSYLLSFYQERDFFTNSECVVLQNPQEPFGGKRRRFDHDVLRFFFLGQLERHKGLDLLIASLADVKARFELHVAGRGSLETWLRDQMKTYSWIAHHGHVERDALEKLWAGIDFLIVPTRTYENSPSVVFEAMGHGVPVIVADIGGSAEVIRDSHNGFVFVAGDQTSLRDVVERVVHLDDAAKESMSRNAYESSKHYWKQEYLKKFWTVLRGKIIERRFAEYHIGK